MSFSYVLPDEILIIIFNSCDARTLSQISMVCKQFYRVSYEILDKKSHHLPVTNQMSKKFRERCKPLLLSINSKFTTYYNWKNGKCEKSEKRQKERGNEDHLTNQKCLQVTKNMVWFCTQLDGDLFAYNRAKDGTIKESKNIVETCYSYTFITTITHCNDEIISGELNGNIKRWRIKESQDKGNYITHSIIYDVDDKINEIDATSQLIITVSDDTIKLLKYTDDKDGCMVKNQLCVEDESRVTSISFDPTGTKFAFLLYDFASCRPSLLLYDINQCCPVIEDNYLCDKLKINDRFYTRQILWDDPHTIVMCCRRSIKKIDIRTSKFVRTWNAPATGKGLRCISSDNLYTFITGSDKAILWDQRQSVPIQTYIVYNDKNNYIHYLEFDSAHMYAATHNSLFELDFMEKDHFDYKK